jgi:hypothetical protein
MRTTITLDDDVAVRLERVQREQGVSFKQAVNQTLRAGLDRSAPASSGRYEFPTFRMGLKPGINLDRALALAAELEDREIAVKLTRRK